MNSVTYNKELFNPAFFHKAKYNADPSVRMILEYGGSSGAKTHGFCQLHTIYGAFEGGYSTAVFRKELAVIKDTIKPEFEDVMSRVMKGLDGVWTKYDFEYRSIDGNRIRFKGLDKSDKAKGLKGFKKIYCDELDQFKKEEWEELKRRLRGEDGQQLHASWNPVSENHWLKKWLDEVEWEEEELPKEVEGFEGWSKLSENSSVRRSKDGRIILIKVTYLDNKWIVGGEVDGRSYGRVDDQVIAEFEDMKLRNYDDYEVYGLGLWGQVKNDKPFFPTLRKQCMKRFDLDPDYDLLISFDFNIDECAAVAMQFKPGKGIFIYYSWGEYGGIRKLCERIKEDIDIDDFNIKITGDATGRNGSAYAGIKSTGEKINMYSIIAEQFELPVTKSRFLNSKVNKEHYMSFSLCEHALWKIPHFFHTDYANDLWVEMKNAKCKDKIGKVELLKDADNMNNRVDAYRYGVEGIFPNQIGKNEATRHSVKRAYAEIVDESSEVLDWYNSLPMANERSAA